MSENPQGPAVMPAQAPKPKRILALGNQPKSVGNFFAWYLLHLMHGEQLVSVYTDDEGNFEPQVLNEEFDAIFLLNHYFSDLSPYLNQAPTVFVVENLTQPLNPVEGSDGYIVARERSDKLVFLPGGSDFRRLIMAQETRSGKPTPDNRRALSSILIDVLTHFRLGGWWMRPEPVVNSPVVGCELARHGEVKFDNVMQVLMMLDALPAYADRESSRLHDRLEHVIDDGGMLPLQYKPAGSYETLDEFFAKPLNTKPAL